MSKRVDSESFFKKPPSIVQIAENTVDNVHQKDKLIYLNWGRLSPIENTDTNSKYLWRLEKYGII